MTFESPDVSRTPGAAVERESIDVVIATINEADCISATVEACLAVGATSVLVVDGGSADSTAVLARDAGATVLSSARGRGSQFQSGAARCASDVLLFLHADSVLPEGFRSEVNRAVDCGFVGGCFRQRIDADAWWYRWIERGNAWRAEKLGWIYGDQAMFVRRDVFERMGGFKEIPLMEDLEFSRRLKREGKAIVLDGPVIVSARRWQQQGVIYCTIRNWCFVLLYQLGVSPERLANWYRNVR